MSLAETLAAAPEGSEREMAALVAAVASRLGISSPHAESEGASPYAPSTIVLQPAGLEHGARVQARALARSHNGAGAYKGRGRWLTAVLVTPSPAGDWAVCSPDDRGAEQVGAYNAYLRPWAIEADAAASAGLGSLAGVFAGLGL